MSSVVQENKINRPFFAEPFCIEKGNKKNNDINHSKKKKKKKRDKGGVFIMYYIYAS